jgi:ribosomal protein L11 methyltransferase
MNMGNIIYIEYAFKVAPLQPASDILIAELGAAGFESFVEEEDGVLAYIQKKEYKQDVLEDVSILNNPNFVIKYEIKEIEQENWNATWESNFEPILVDDVCMIRAPFHESKSIEYDIVIEPKMSFGTGHHETTHMMLQHLLVMNIKDKRVLDMGSGTGVLAILAAMKGATVIDAIDIDHWCYLNAVENIERNNVPKINVYEGDASLLKNKQYDLIIANINRNILLQDIPKYASCLSTKGVLLLSGFYKDDLSLINEACQKVQLKFENNIEKNNWVASKYVI